MPTPSARRLRQLFPLVLLAGAAAAIFVIALGEVGGSTSSARTESEVVTAADGVAQETVTGTGNLEPVTDDDVNFTTSGTLSNVYVKVGNTVHKGELLATLSPTAAELTLAEAEATLTAAKATLATAEDDEATSDDASTDQTATKSTPTTTPSGSGASGSGGTTSTAATVDADEVTVDSDEDTVKSDEAAVADTRLRAPVSGVITSMAGLTAGDAVTAGSDSSSSDSSSSDSSTSSTASGSLGGTSTTASSTSTSSTPFAEIISLHHLSMTVAFDESDISKVKVGESATVTLDALTGVELAAKVTAVSSLGTTSDSVVSYDATLTRQQQDAKVKPGMSASSAVVVSQGQGVTVPDDAVTGTGTLATVTELLDGKDVEKEVIVGTRGDTRDVILSGLKAGAQLVVTEALPSETTTTSSSSSSSSSGTLGGSTGGATGGFAGRASGAGQVGGAGGPP
jgi:macrolide-specific efflux system membrane fusion protein